jgi:hypothetical protein
MSYLHCPTCRCAYNVTATPACPACGVRAGAPADAADDVVAAAEQLARAVARATPAQLAQAQAELAMRESTRALPAPGKLPLAATSIVRAVRAALSPASASASTSADADSVVTGRAHTALLATAVLALLTRVPKPRATLRWAQSRVATRVQALLS